LDERGSWSWLWWVAVAVAVWWLWRRRRRGCGCSAGASSIAAGVGGNAPPSKQSRAGVDVFSFTVPTFANPSRPASLPGTARGCGIPACGCGR